MGLQSRRTNEVSALRKITVQVPESDLALAQQFTGEGVTETVRTALKKLASIHAQQELLKLRGKIKFDLDIDEMREDKKWSPSTRRR
jgi:hypothetical protein